MEQNNHYLAYIATIPGLNWNQRVSSVSKSFGVDAATAAQMLDPYYKTLDDLKWMIAYISNPALIGFIDQVGALVHNGSLKWSDGVGHVASQLKIPADKAAKLLSHSMKSRH